TGCSEDWPYAIALVQVLHLTCCGGVTIENTVVTMEAKTHAIWYFKRLVRQKRPINKEEFAASIDTLRIAANDGFEDKEVETLIDALINTKNLSSGRFQDLLKCIVPRQTIATKSGLKILQWIFTCYADVPISTVVAAMEWMIGLIEFHLIDEEAVHAFYHHFFILINMKSLAKFACKLIYLLTRLNDISRWRVKTLLSIESKFGKQNYLTALLALFKSYKPECVPEKVPAISLEFAFKNIGKMNVLFDRAQQRAGARRVNTQTRKITWNSHQIPKKRRIKGKWNAIPDMEYVHFESARYREVKLPSIYEFQTLNTLGTQTDVDMPCNLMSLLQNEAGMHVLLFADSSYHSRFSFHLYHTLYAGFIQEESMFSYEEKEKFLTQLVKLEEYMQQGIPVVSRFLAEYMHVWDGDDYRDQILQLMQWNTFSSYPELYHIILVHIRRIFMCADVKMKALILRMLGKFVQNLITVGIFRRKKTAEHKLPMWTMMPPEIVYHGLVSRSALLLSRVCDLLLKYENVNPRLKSMKLRKKFTEQINNQRLYLAEFNNSLLKGKCFHEDSYITSEINDKHISRFVKFVNPDVALLLQNHFAMQPYIAAMMKASDNIRVLRNSEPILEEIQCYKGAGKEIREAISTPTEEYQQRAWQAVMPLVSRLKRFYEFSTELELVVPKILFQLCSGPMTPTQHLETQQALVKQFAEILEFVLKFDEYKMKTPAIQNDFSYYRRTITRQRMSSHNGFEHQDTREVTNELANRMSLFYAHATPMLKVLSEATSTCTEILRRNSKQNSVSFLSIGITSNNVSLILFKIQGNEIGNLIAQFQREETQLFVLRVMVGLVILYDHVYNETPERGSYTKEYKESVSGLKKEELLFDLI
ncbi:hypothetical protein C0J52_11271, partial [Blattella germanica]